MGATSGKGGAAGGKGAAGGGGQTRRTLTSRSLRPGDELYFANPDKREVKQARAAYQRRLDQGATPTYAQSLGVTHLRATVSKVLGKGKGYELEIRKGSEPLIKKFNPKVASGGKERRVKTRVKALAPEVVGATTLRDGKWRYKIKS